MVDDIESVAKVVSLNGGTLIGKTRLQKTIYFMEILGIGFGYDYEYYHYGPYCEEVNNIVDISIMLDWISMEMKCGNFGVNYAIFHSSIDLSASDIEERRKSLLNVLDRYDAICLELAATADFLHRDGFEDPWEETRRRKSSKSTEGRILKAKQLIGEIGAF